MEELELWPATNQVAVPSMAVYTHISVIYVVQTLKEYKEMSIFTENSMPSSLFLQRSDSEPHHMEAE